ncbi:hypothetical protein UFOVP1217_14 [uncultured Caudovirales phage]|uniref:Uncharacterized protein n=2 Tax=uncultured Caudovirales phage TaxID=2100421 RepID=A0A6J5MID5_9CAUD|nr:hypothetical protein UFOVP465_92 [uncultured Caudovirales phage]CAB4156746.1 hypothetical protein UFOVP666_138 [uncultured Caudovirales phage]CAB4160008.1 hypothetical protein UFOVP727_27 [uncultured Caudovirales phage]CAB4164897.1 hypothetical protein UFOVP819_166 [uncultured Caudovirales phage]CAB4191223.1 hypothetical protein UFOVP1217_14 [uncultured Caudovirales phage]
MRTVMTTESSKKKPKKKNALSKLYGGGNNDMTRSMRDHPTYKKPELRLVK